MFRATIGPSSGDTTALMRHLVLVTVCGWPSGTQEHMHLRARQSGIQAFSVGDCLVLTSLCSCVPDSQVLRYSLWMTVWYAGAYAPACQTVRYSGIICGWLSGIQEHMLLRARQSGIQALSVDDYLVFRSICSCVPDSQVFRHYLWMLLRTKQSGIKVFSVDDYLVFRSICSCVPDSQVFTYSLWMTIWYSGAYAPACQTVRYSGIICGWLSGMQEHMLLHTRQSSTQNNKYQV